MPGPSTPKGPRKKSPAKGEPRQYGTLIRVSEEFADALRQAASFEQVSMRDFADTHFLAFTRKRYRDAVLEEAKRIQGQGQ